MPTLITLQFRGEGDNLIPNIIIYDKLTGKVTDYQESVPEDKYSGRDDVIENPNTLDRPVKYWKWDGKNVVEQTSQEKMDTDNAEAESVALQNKPKSDLISAAQKIKDDVLQHPDLRDFMGKLITWLG